MVQVKYGELVTELKGKAGGFVFKGGYSAPSIQLIGNPIQKHSAFNKWNKGYLANISARWREMTIAQRDDWNTVALGWEFINCFGDPYYGSGYQVYMQSNLNLNSIGMPWNNTARNKKADWEFDDITTTWTEDINECKIIFEGIDTPGNWHFYIQSSAPRINGEYAIPNKIRFVRTLSNAGGPPWYIWSYDVNTVYDVNVIQLFKYRIYFRIVAIEEDTGQSVVCPGIFINSPESPL